MVFYYFSCAVCYPLFLDNSYISEAGHKVVNLVVREESSELMKVSKISMKFVSGDNKPRAAVIFLTTSDPTEEGRLEKVGKYDSLTAEEFEKLREGYAIGLC